MREGESYQSYSKRVGEEAAKRLKSQELTLKTVGKSAEKKKA